MNTYTYTHIHDDDGKPQQATGQSSHKHSHTHTHIPEPKNKTGAQEKRWERTPQELQGSPRRLSLCQRVEGAYIALA